MRFLLTALAVALAIVAGSAQTGADPIVVLISFDGWRWDYIDRAQVPHLRALASRGVRADGLIPSFPSKTFPNHYTLVTGLYPEHHGIVSNVVVDPGFPERFTMSSQTAKSARWWSGEPCGTRRCFRAVERLRCSGRGLKLRLAACDRRIGGRSTTRCRTLRAWRRFSSGWHCPEINSPRSSRCTSAMSIRQVMRTALIRHK